VFRLPAKDQPTNSVADASELLISRKQQKRMKNVKRQVVSLGSAENMVISLADPTYVKSLVNYALFDGVVSSRGALASAVGVHSMTELAPCRR
jgi:hypothetical protein